MLYGPTNEELVTDIFRSSVKSYKSLPQLLYHIQWKFRDEVRPRFGIMRGREFYMKANNLGLRGEEARGIFVVSDGKANLAPPATEAVYRKMVGVQIANGEYVGTCTLFKMPDLFDGVTAKDAMRCQKAVGMAAQEDEPLRANVQAKRWVGHTVGEELGLDTADRAEKSRVAAIVRKWIETDVLRTEMLPCTRTGRDVPCVVVGTWITGDEAGM